MFTAPFWKSLAERVLSSVAGALLAVFTADGFDLLNADWSSALGVAGLAGLVSLLKGLIASRVGDNPGPSLVDSERVVTSPQHLA